LLWVEKRIDEGAMTFVDEVLLMGQRGDIIKNLIFQSRAIGKVPMCAYQPTAHEFLRHAD